MDIEAQIRQLDFRDPEQVIKFYESNRLYYEDYERIEDHEKLSNFIDIKLHYANSLFDKSHFDKMFKVLNEVSDLLTMLPPEHWNYSKSERHVRFLRVMALARKKKFKESYPIFKELVKEDPEHHFYREWYQSSKMGLYDWVFNLAASFGLLLILTDVFFMIILKAPLPFDFALTGMMTMFLALIVKTGVKELIKRRKTTPNNG